MKERTVSTSVTPDDSSEPPAHPLGIALARTLERGDATRVLVLGYGSGRTLPALLERGVRIDVIESDPARARAAMDAYSAEPRVRIARGSYDGPYAFTSRYAGALSTHALLHGSHSAIARAVASIADRLVTAGIVHATFGSVRDPRFVTGLPLEPFVSAPRDGPEAGIPHAYFAEPQVRSLLAAFELDELCERSAAQTAGAWAHDDTELRTMVHWFVRARKR